MNKFQTSVKLAVVIGLSCAALALAVPRLQSPSEFLHGDQYRTAVVKIAEITEEGRFRLEVIEQLFGETADGLVVRAPGVVAGQIELGKTYIIGHTDKPARKSYRWKVDPEGSRILTVPTVGLAVFEVDDAMKSLLKDYPEEAPISTQTRLDSTVALFENGTLASRRFAAAELALSPETRDAMGEEELGAIKSIVADSEIEPVAHEYLLRAATPMIETWGGDWLAASTRKVVASYGPELDLGSPIPSLLVASFKTLGVTGTEADAKLAEPHIPSNNPGVGKAAFRAMMNLDSKLAEQLAPAILENPEVHPDTRRVVAEFWARTAQAATGE